MQNALYHIHLCVTGRGPKTDNAKKKKITVKVCATTLSLLSITTAAILLKPVYTTPIVHTGEEWLE